ncbi:transglycosylase domain-containing protein [Pseudonocardia ammonioxydans]|uniref:transglycosylase domain-containing protein n=1 Tax=Pseudonocardia ammonioxydans TaxID=260086 RepID=UPI001160DC85|nr:transglycosylase domain-containing protein [Pseudonocardia ammonioxydans]
MPRNPGTPGTPPPPGGGTPSGARPGAPTGARPAAPGPGPRPVTGETRRTPAAGATPGATGATAPGGPTPGSGEQRPAAPRPAGATTPPRTAGAPGPASPDAPAPAHPAGTPAPPHPAGADPTGVIPTGAGAPAPGRRPDAPQPGRRRAPEAPEPARDDATRVVPAAPEDDDDLTAYTGAGTGAGAATTVAPAVTDVADRPRRRRRAEPERPLDRVVALVGPGVGAVRSRLGILDAEQKAALTPQERRTRRRKQIRYSLIGTAASFVLLPLLLFGIGWLIFPVPNEDEAVQKQIATVSFADGGQLARLVPEQGNRIKVGMEAIPPHVREAVLAAEDRSFYSNPGFDITGILRAAFNQVLGGAGGGSTITQQYVKNTLVGNDATYWRKYKELIVSLKVSGQKSKDEILNGYLNAIYFGRGAYGIESASLAYYGKPAAQMTPSEGALLAGIIQSPSNWDPANSPDSARQRWSFVLDGMEQQGWISGPERDAAVFPQTLPPENTSRSSSLTDERGHILNAVRSELGSLGISEQAFAQGGLQVTTTIDPQRQQQLTDAVSAELQDQPEVLRSGAVAIDPQTGGIIGYYGGENGAGLDYATVMKQPGSTFKPFAVLAGLMEDPPVGLGTVFDGSERPGLRNAEGANCPRCDLKQAMTISNNVVFTKLAAQIGPQKVADAARLAGITASMENPDPRLPLGNKEVTPVQLASSYATIAAGGVWHAPHMVSRVVDSEGRVLYEYSPGEGEQRFPEQVARNVAESMMDVVEHDGLELPGGQQAAGKTGTVQSRFEGENNDAWFAGFTPEFAAAVWIGTDRNDPIRNAAGEPINGKDLPADVWQEFMADAVRSTEVVEFPTFRPLGESPSELAANEPTETPTPTPSSSAPPPPPSPEPVEEAPPPEPEVPVEPTTTPEPTVDPRNEPLQQQDEPDQPGEDAGRDGEPTFG